MERWRGATAVVTGAGGGIGAGVAAALAGAGMRVVALDIMADEDIRHNLTAQVKSEDHQRLYARSCDVTDPGQLVDTFRWVDEHHEGIHVLVNCAGVLYPGHITDVGDRTLSMEQLGKTLDVNAKAVVMCTKLAVESMRRRGVAGHIVNINSLAGHYVPFVAEMNVYAASKYAVTAFTAALQQELADFRSDIKVTSISPGKTRTGLAKTMLEALAAPAAAELLPADVAAAVLQVLAMPPHINVTELAISCVGEKRM